MLLRPPPIKHPNLQALRNTHSEFDGYLLLVSPWVDKMDQFDYASLLRWQSMSRAILKETFYLVSSGLLTSIPQYRYVFQLRKVAIEMSILAGLSDPGSTYQITLTPQAISQLSLIEGWDMVKQPNPSFDVSSVVRTIINGATIQEGSVSTTSTHLGNDYYYAIHAGDTPQQIALRFTGNAANWEEIVAYNSLRYPWFSDNPRNQYGEPLQSGVLQNSTVSGASNISLTGANWTMLLPGMLIYLEAASPTSGLLYEAIPIQSVDTVNNLVTLQSATVNTYPTGGTWIVFDNPINVKTKVLKTGDILRIPGHLMSQENFVARNADFVGTDLYLQGGQFKFENGDLATVSGWDNLNQAIANRFATTLGDLPYHPDYGNELKQIIGTQAATNATFAKFLLKSTLMQDPRITGVRDVSVSIVGDQWQIQATVLVGNSEQGIAIQIP